MRVRLINVSLAGDERRRFEDCERLLGQPLVRIGWRVDVDGGAEGDEQVVVVPRGGGEVVAPVCNLGELSGGEAERGVLVMEFFFIVPLLSMKDLRYGLAEEEEGGFTAGVKKKNKVSARL